MSSDSNTPMQPKTYGCKVGQLWVEIDFEAQAVAITVGERVIGWSAPTTEEIARGVLLIDRNERGEVCSVEVLG